MAASPDSAGVLDESEQKSSKANDPTPILLYEQLGYKSAFVFLYISWYGWYLGIVLIFKTIHIDHAFTGGLIRHVVNVVHILMAIYVYLTINDQIQFDFSNFVVRKYHTIWDGYVTFATPKPGIVKYSVLIVEKHIQKTNAMIMTIVGIFIVNMAIPLDTTPYTMIIVYCMVAMCLIGVFIWCYRRVGVVSRLQTCQTEHGHVVVDFIKI
jgi:hypothetical protein